MQLISVLNRFFRHSGRRIIFVFFFVADIIAASGQISVGPAVGRSPLRKLYFKKYSREIERQRDLKRELGAAFGKQKSTSTTQGEWAGTGSSSLRLVIQDPNGILPWYHVSLLDTFGHVVYYGQTDSVLVIEGLHAGKYTPELDMYHAQWYLGQADNIAQAQWIRLNDGETADCTIALPDSIPTEDGGELITITGNIVSPNGALPHVGFDLIAVGVVNRSLKAHIRQTSDHKGNFSARLSLPPGEYYILINADGHIPVWWNGEPYTAAPQSVSLADDISGNEIQLSPGAAISGKILDSDAPLSYGVTVQCLDNDGLVIASYYVRSNDSTYSLEGLPSGSYYIKMESWSDYKTSYYPATEDFNSAQPVHLDNGEQKSVELTVLVKNNNVSRPTGAVQGSLTFHNDPTKLDGDVRTIYEDSTLDDLHWGWIDEGIYFHEVQAENPFKILIEPYQDYYVARTWYPGVLEEQNATLITPVADDTVRAPIDMKEGGSAAGFLTYHGKNIHQESTTNCEFEGIVIVDRPGGNRPQYADVTRVSGYRIIGLAPGNYEGYFLPMSDGSCSSTPSWTRLPEFTVQAGKTTKLPELSLAVGSGSITGKGWFGDAVVLCVNNNHEIVSYNWPIIKEDEGGLLDEFFVRDREMLKEIRPIDFVIPSLAAGNYYLAVLNFDYNSTENYIDWYGTGTVTAAPSEAYLTPPEDATLITVGEGQNVTIDMSSAGPENRGFPNDPRSSVRVHPADGRMNVTVAIKDNLAPDAELMVHNCRGQLVHRLKITEKNQTVSWSAGSAGISSGTYLFSLRNKGVVLTRRANLLK